MKVPDKNKKVWVKPAVQMLSINKDTYSNKTRGFYEKAGAEGNARKEIPS